MEQALTAAPATTIRVGVSACLLGERVRYDGGHKQDRYISDTLGRFFSFLPVCPEVECGLPVPREAMRLEGDPDQPRLITLQSRMDKTEQMLAFCANKVRELESEDLCGFIFKQNSPSSGLLRVKVYGPAGTPPQSGSGLFAAAVARHFPLLPLEEEGRLNGPAIRENFIERVFCYRRWKDFLRGTPDMGSLVEFHSRHKLLMLAHSPQIYREMGALVEDGRKMKREELLRSYAELMLRNHV